MADAPQVSAREPRTGERHSRVVLALAAEHGVDIDALTGTGTGGRVHREDVLAAAADAGVRSRRRHRSSSRGCVC